ncbi:hypothetical protein D2E51_17815 [Mycobacteroides abscessus]|uniref:Uncharacterized protein n=1 Tax=Mycobacteroides abscessus TaxID=36809 RepID=A0AB33TCP6_9MYCO|nr:MULTISPECIES: hypothetical protein [Mycobacteroides]MEC4836104.1 hypothetical protein [Mycobacteroides chelonae]RIS93705.1 hypothetical protein D2E51_17815 [Mycobacteroides abscessus]CPT67019.1 Uncharacterised protein [Mycobacteroides abscessus]CPT76995.1 Uncharacterised protein [Mycobacteroides abscessus]CPV17566.1 Uncharacterised protein [Mycobacteroides abscessus]
MNETLTAQQLASFEDSLNNYAGDGELPTIRTDYSGRAMYGRECLAVVLDDSSFTPAVTAELAYVLADTDDDVAELVDRIWSLPTYTDNMGHRTVIYWPNIKAPNTAGED